MSDTRRQTSDIGYEISDVRGQTSMDVDKRTTDDEHRTKDFIHQT